jgi:hypothetical protein
MSGAVARTGRRQRSEQRQMGFPRIRSPTRVISSVGIEDLELLVAALRARQQLRPRGHEQLAAAVHAPVPAGGCVGAGGDRNGRVGFFAARDPNVLPIRRYLANARSSPRRTRRCERVSTSSPMNRSGVALPLADEPGVGRSRSWARCSAGLPAGRVRFRISDCGRRPVWRRRSRSPPARRVRSAS